MERVSLIVPAYKADRWIDECMASIHAQTYKNLETIVINDREGKGAWHARNRGLEKATGKYVAFCDADDIMAPDAIEKMVEAMDGVDMVCGSFRKFGDFEETVTHESRTLNMDELSTYVMGNLQNPRRNQMLSGCWAKLYIREEVTGFPALTTAEDMAFNFRYLMECMNVRFLSDVVYHNRKHAGSLSTTFDESKPRELFCVVKALRDVRRFMNDWYFDGELDDALDNSKMYHSMLYFTRVCQQTGWSNREALMRLFP